MITNPFVYIETKPYQHNKINQRIKMDSSTLTKTGFPREYFHVDNQTLTKPKKSNKINRARPLIYIRRPKAF